MTTKHPLDQLIEGVKRANRWSDPDLVNNAKERNRELSKSNISRLRRPLVSIKSEIIYALAAGLRVSEAQVAIAAIESMGIALPQYDSPTPEQSVRLDTSLSVKDKGVILALLKQLRTSTPAGTSPKAGQAQEAKSANKGEYRTDLIGPVFAREHTGVDRADDGEHGEDLGREQV